MGFWDLFTSLQTEEGDGDPPDAKKPRRNDDDEEEEKLLAPDLTDDERGAAPRA